MATKLELGQRIKTPEDIKKIKYPEERAFAELLLTMRPHIEIVYEPELFEHPVDENRTEGTLPDFYLRNPRTGSKGIYVEITQAQRNGNNGISDPKARQKRVMEDVHPKKRYVVLYGENLAKIQKVHPKYNFSRNGNHK